MYNTRNIGVHECSSDGVIIKTWSSITEAAKHNKMCRHKLASIIDKSILHKSKLFKSIEDPDLEGEIWTDINENAQISNLGRFKTKLGKKHRGTLKNEYLSVCTKNKHAFIHRLVATYFKPTTRNDLVVDHLDGDTKNNVVDNLEWVTPSVNLQRAHERKKNKK